MDAEAMVFVVADDAPLRASLQDLMQSVGLRVAAFASAQGRSQLLKFHYKRNP
jgi:FixJ family two-component response regulator